MGSAYLPVTGGLFLGDDASDALSNLTGRFWISQDQRHTIRTRARHQFTNRVWGGVGAEYGTGLPFEFTGDEADALAQSSQQVVDLTAVAGTYITIAMMVAMAEQSIPAGEELPFKAHEP